MGTFSWFRLAAIAVVAAILAGTAAGADTGKGPGNDKDKDKKDTSPRGSTDRGGVERSSSTRSSTSDSPKSSSANRDNSRDNNRIGPVAGRPGVSGPDVRQTAVNAPAVRGPVQMWGNAGIANQDGRSQWERDRWERDQWNRDRWDREWDDQDRWQAERELQAGANFYNANRFVSGTGTVVGLGNGVMLVSAGGTNYQVAANSGATIEVTGTAGPDFLKPGMTVKFQAPFDLTGPTGYKAIGALTSLEIITPHAGEAISAIPVAANAGGNAAGNGNDAAPNVAANAALPATARTITVIGRISNYAKNELTVSTQGHVFKAELDPVPDIKIRMSDARYVSPGDQVDLTGYFLRPGIVSANHVSIKLASPLGDPLSEVSKQKSARVHDHALPRG